jgi:hypothetical protein
VLDVGDSSFLCKSFQELLADVGLALSDGAKPHCKLGEARVVVAHRSQVFEDEWCISCGLTLEATGTHCSAPQGARSPARLAAHCQCVSMSTDLLYLITPDMQIQKCVEVGVFRGASRLRIAETTLDQLRSYPGLLRCTDRSSIRQVPNRSAVRSGGTQSPNTPKGTKWS